MTSTQQLSTRLASYRDPEAIALIRFLIDSETYSVAQRLGLTDEEARDNVAERCLDFLSGAAAKLQVLSQS